MTSKRSDHWQDYLRVEREQLAKRAEGQLARALGYALPGESREGLELLAREDQVRARLGFLELRDEDGVWHKHIDDLTPEDRPARIEAETARNCWLTHRVGLVRMSGNVIPLEELTSQIYL